MDENKNNNNVPLSPLFVDDIDAAGFCPVCNNLIRRSEDECSNCGQKIDWGEGKES